MHHRLIDFISSSFFLARVSALSSCRFPNPFDE
jgi:hypothetical protein